MDWWTLVNRCRAVENIAYVVAANQAASLSHYPPFSWPGGSMLVDFEGRILAQADPGPGEKIVVATIDVGALRHERATRRGHQTLGHLRTECYPMYQQPFYPGGRGADRAHLAIEPIDDAIAAAKRRLGYS
jgi:predicted amidohydrolase